MKKVRIHVRKKKHVQIIYKILNLTLLALSVSLIIALREHAQLMFVTKRVNPSAVLDPFLFVFYLLFTLLH